MKKIPVNLLRILADLSEVRRELEDLFVEEIRAEQALSKIHDRKYLLEEQANTYLRSLAETPLRGPEIEFPLQRDDPGHPAEPEQADS